MWIQQSGGENVFIAILIVPALEPIKSGEVTPSRKEIRETLSASPRDFKGTALGYWWSEISGSASDQARSSLFLKLNFAVQQIFRRNNIVENG
jgi:hypothetical protein